MPIHPLTDHILLLAFRDAHRCNRWTSRTPTLPISRSLRQGSSGGTQGLVEIGDDVVDVLDADRQAHVAGRHAAGELVAPG